MDRVGVRELRQNLSVYLRRVADGETLQVTDHGHAVAVLGPLPDPSPLDLLVAEGRVRLGGGRLVDLPPPPGPGSDAGTRALTEQRADEV